jgi:CubicO group peptidase (beta-lactamase class C family)
MTWPRLTIKRIGWILGAILLSGVTMSVVFLASEWTYLRRMWQHPSNSILDVAWYLPKEAVAGSRESLSAVGPADDNDRAAFAEAARLAETKNAAALLVIQRGRVVLERHWHGHRTKDWTNSASMAKSITALLIGIALDERKIGSLDDPASKWIPAWRDDARRRITLKHLLQMHAGLRPMGKYEDPYSDASYLALGTDLRYVVDNVPAETEPGLHFDYNDVNFQALGFVLESATGRRYADYLSEKLWQPIGAGEAALWLDRDGGSARTFGYLFATASDWGRVGLLLLHEGEWNGKAIFSRDYLREMLKPSPSEPTYGMGIWLANDDHQRREGEPPFLAPGIFYLDGRHKQRVYVIPSHDVVIVRLGENARGWEESALPNAVLKGAAGRIRKPIGPAEDPAPATGRRSSRRAG